jgi:hypothetical protein
MSSQQRTALKKPKHIQSNLGLLILLTKNNQATSNNPKSGVKSG